MTLDLAPQTLPFRRQARGVLRFVGTRVSLEHVLRLYKRGRRAEAIARELPTVELAAVHAAIAWYLTHRDEADSYLAERATVERVVHAGISSAHDERSERARLLARRAGRSSR